MTPIPFHRPPVGQEEIDSIVQVLRDGWLSHGPMVERFEREFKSTVGAGAAIAYNSCTSAIRQAMRWYFPRVMDGKGEVLVTSMTFAATAHAIVERGLRPIFVDVDPNTVLMDQEDLESKVSPRTVGIIAVHYGGQTVDMEPLMRIAKEHQYEGFALIEDAAHCMGTCYSNGEVVGSRALMAAFSFYATKPLTTGEGGMLTFDPKRPDYEGAYDRLKVWRMHGVSKDGWKRYTEPTNLMYDIVDYGDKVNMTDMNAAMGLVQLSKCEEHRLARRRIDGLYRELLDDSIGLVELKAGVSSFHLFPVVFKDDRTRMEAVAALKENGISASLHFPPLHMTTYYQREYGCRDGDCPVATDLSKRMMSLPIWPGMTNEDVDRITKTINKAVRGGLGRSAP